MSDLEISHKTAVYTNEEASSALLIILCTGFIFLMQSGFAMVEVGSVREKNAQNILIKNLFDACAGALAFWLFGYGFAYGQTGDMGGFIGHNPETFAASGFENSETNHYNQWVFQFSFAATAATIVSGSLAERAQLSTYLVFSTLMTGFIYPVVVSWTWG